MSLLLDLIQTQLNDSHIDSMSEKIGANPMQTRTAVSQALPLLLGALSSKADSNTGLSFLESMLDKNHDGSALDDIIGMVTGSSGGSAVAPQGQAALKDLVGGQIPALENHIAQNSGLDSSAVAKLLPILAPMVMAALTKAQRAQNLSGKELNSFLHQEGNAISQEASPATQSFLSSILDQNHDGSMMDDMMKMGMNALSNLFKK